MILETGRTVLRTFTPEDLDDLQEIFGDEDVMKNCEPAYDREKTREFLTDFCIRRGGALACVLKETDKVIGYILFNEFDPGVYEMGWFFNKAVWRQGLAYESCKALLDYAFETLNAHKIFAETIDGVTSVGLMQKLGMKPEGIQREQVLDNGGNWADLYLYGILR